MTKKTTSGYDGDYSKGNMGTPSFREKYYEFEQVYYRDRDETGMGKKDWNLIEEILDKDFTRNSEILPSGEYVKKERYDKFKQKVIDEINKLPKGYRETLLVRLGLE